MRAKPCARSGEVKVGEILPLASRTGGRAGTERLRGLPGTGPSFSPRPLSAPVCTEDKVVNAAEVPGYVELIVKGTAACGAQGLTRHLLQHSVTNTRMKKARGGPGGGAANKVLGTGRPA